MTVFAAMYKAAYFLRNGMALGQKKTAKRLFTTVKNYLNTRAVISRANIKTQSLFFDCEKRTLFIYCTRAEKAGSVDICIKAVADNGTAFKINTSEKYQNMGERFASWLNLKLNSQINHWQQITIYTRALQKMPQYKAQSAPLNADDKRRIANSKRQADQFYGRQSAAFWQATAIYNDK